MSGQGLPVTVAIITRNEAARLPALLEALGPAAEVVVVDSCSTDNTAPLAREAGCRVFVRRFDDFASQRNAAIRRARMPWVLSIDADEMPLSGFWRSIGEVVERDRVAAARVPIRSEIFGRRFRFCGTQHDRPIRLFRRGTSQWHGEVHERLHVNGTVGTVRIGLRHDSIRNLQEFAVKMQRYTELEASRRVAEGQIPQAIDAWYRPAREIFRRMVFQLGALDGPEGIAFAALSGLSEWKLARAHRQMHLSRVRRADHDSRLSDDRDVGDSTQYITAQT